MNGIFIKKSVTYSVETCVSVVRDNLDYNLIILTGLVESGILEML